MRTSFSKLAESSLYCQFYKVLEDNNEFKT